MSNVRAEYIWIDGNFPTAKLRSKTKIIEGDVNDLSDLLKSLLVMGILIGLVYNDLFGVIGNIGKLMSNIGDGGLAGLVALVLVVTWWKK